MSRVGQKPVTIPAGVKVTIEGRMVSATGKLGSLSLELPAGIGAQVKGNVVELTRSGDTRADKSQHGTSRTRIQNMFDGIMTGYRKDLEIEGVGFKAALQGTRLDMAIGYSHPIRFEIPAGIKIAVEGSTKLAITGMDKQLVGEVAARLRGYYPAEPYKGKGLRYKGEHVRRKEGKTVA